MDEVAGPGHEGLEPLGARERPFGVTGRLDGVDVVVVSADVPRVSPQDRLEDGDDHLGALRWRAIRVPEPPGAEVHEAFRIERRRVEIIGVALAQLSHGNAVLDRQRLQIRGRMRRVPPGESLDVVSLGLWSAPPQRLSPLDGRRCGPFALGIDVEVDVRAEGERDAPVRHRGLRIHVGGVPEGPHGLVVVEGEDESEAIVEEALRLGIRRRNGMMVRDHPRWGSGVLRIDERRRHTGGRHSEAQRDDGGS